MKGTVQGWLKRMRASAGTPLPKPEEGKTVEELTELFRQLGMLEPEETARSQFEEGTDYLSQFVFLREAWKTVVEPESFGWIENSIADAKRHPNGPCAGMGPALERILAAGVDRRDLQEVVRGMQYETLFSLCALLDEPDELEPELGGLEWQLVRTTEDGDVVGQISGLHESVLQMDPTGREMRPERPRRNPT